MTTSQYTPNSEIPYGYCHCGCGQKTSLAKQNDSTNGNVKNKPFKYIKNHHKRPRATFKEQAESFWSQVIITADDNQCWLWTGGGRNGYGYKTWNGKQERTNRIAWSYPNYVIPDGMFICHSCDNRACCNPKHLFLGTRQDNVDDMVSKDRQAKGFKLPQCKLTDEQVCDIRDRYAKKESNQRELAIEYGVDQSYISYLIHNKKRVLIDDKNIT